LETGLSEKEIKDSFQEKALEKQVDVFKDELVVHGTFIENLKEILKNGLKYEEARPKRMYAGYGKPYANAFDFALPWEDSTGRGLYCSRINNETAYCLNNLSFSLPNLSDLKKGLSIIKEYAGLENLQKEERNLRQKYCIPQDVDLETTPGYLSNIPKDEDENQEITEKLLNMQKGNLTRQNIKLQQALKNVFKEEKVADLEKITLTDFIDENGNPKAVKLNVDGKQREIFYDIDGWLKLKNLERNSFASELESGFASHYPVHLILNPEFFKNYSNFVYNFKHNGNIPKKAILGLMITLNNPKESSDDDLWAKKLNLERRTYLPLRNRENKKVKEIKKEALIRWLKPQIIKLFKENPEMALPLYDEEGTIIYP
ncbi:hypothetical protein FJ208_00955, partial [Candidatus Gribaldobacteria bacterium]|nr:hypothetical protein [Candidatus Gribaldobacteria bacterium]